MAVLSEEELQDNEITHLYDGQFYCRLCGKQPSDMDRVKEHIGSLKHTRKMRTKAYYDDPLSWVPVEQRQWTEIINREATCKLCHKEMVETHWNCALHLKNVEWEISQQQQPPLPPVPPAPRRRSSGSDSAAYSPVLERKPCDVWQSSATLPEMHGQQHDISSGNKEGLWQAPADWIEQRSGGSCIATEVTDTDLDACRPDADQTPCGVTTSLDEEGRVIYYV